MVSSIAMLKIIKTLIYYIFELLFPNFCMFFEVSKWLLLYEENNNEILHNFAPFYNRNPELCIYPCQLTHRTTINAHNFLAFGVEQTFCRIANIAPFVASLAPINRHFVITHFKYYTFLILELFVKHSSYHHHRHTFGI